MCKSLPFGALGFDLYSACPFESLPVVPAAGPAVTAPKPVVLVGVQPSREVSPIISPARSAEQFRFGYMDVDPYAGSMDAPLWLPSGSHVSRLYEFSSFHFYAFDGLGVCR